MVGRIIPFGRNGSIIESLDEDDTTPEYDQHGRRIVYETVDISDKLGLYEDSEDPLAVVDEIVNEIYSKMIDRLNSGVNWNHELTAGNYSGDESAQEVIQEIESGIKQRLEAYFFEEYSGKSVQEIPLGIEHEEIYGSEPIAIDEYDLDGFDTRLEHLKKTFTIPELKAYVMLRQGADIDFVARYHGLSTQVLEDLTTRVEQTLQEINSQS